MLDVLSPSEGEKSSRIAAALVPLAVLAALASPFVRATRRRRREHALR